MLIYRGDRSDDAKVYRTEGIMTRLMNGGNPATVSSAGLWEVSRAHVQPQGVTEERFLAATPFLSFTEDRARAEYYARGGVSGSLVPCAGQFGEDTIVFELETEGMQQDGQEGVFVLDYPCDYGRVEPLAPGEDAVDEAAAVSCEYCAPENEPSAARVDGQERVLHRIQLIRVATFLRQHPERQRYKDALGQAEKDREWLIYPMDYVRRLRGFASRVPPARIWTACRYKLLSRSQEEPAGIGD